MRMIDADALKEAFYRKMKELLLSTDTPQISYEALSLLCGTSLIADAPTIEERKNGKWLEQDDGWDGIYYECSCCKDAFTLIDGNPSENLYNYCPNCGARMVQEGENND